MTYCDSTAASMILGLGIRQTRRVLSGVPHMDIPRINGLGRHFTRKWLVKDVESKKAELQKAKLDPFVPDIIDQESNS